MAKKVASSYYHSRNRIQSSACRPSSPSAGILSILASILASTSANGHPLDCQSAPPNFLCPSVEHLGIPDEARFAEPSSSSLPPIVPTPKPRSRARRSVPESYTQGADGRWRKVTEWTFYGSTMCLCNDISSDSSTINAAPSLDPDALPTGWVTSNTGTTKSVFILLVSLILACVIALSIVGSIYWKKRRKEEAEKDPERRAGRTRGPKEDSVDVRGRIKSRLWAKASARWRDNVKHSALRRRNSRFTSTSQPNLSPSRPQSSAHLPVSISSRSTTPTPSTAGDHDISHGDVHDCDSPASHDLVLEPSASLTSPPAYHGSTANPPSSLVVSHICPSEDSDEPPDAARSSSLPRDHSLSLNNEWPRYTSSLHIAHVATDDKAVLQRMVIMGSEPPADRSSLDGSHETLVSAPVLFEDDERNIPDDTEALSSGDSVSSIFPSPPEPQPSSKGKMVAYEYDDLDVELPPGPSAPPFEASHCSEPSAPLQTDILTPMPDEEVGVGNSSSPSEGGVDGCDSQTGSSHVISRNEGRSRSELLPQYQP